LFLVRVRMSRSDLAQKRHWSAIIS
jgi:hypothetical protein